MQIVDAQPDSPMPVMGAAMIGPAGGTLDVPGVITVSVPPDALGTNTMVTVSESMTTMPDGALSPVYSFGPKGLVFARPVKITLALPTGTAAADLYWSKPAGQTGFDNIGGGVQNGDLVGEVLHFSEGYAGAPATTRTVTGSQVIARVSASAVELAPVDLSAFSVAALVENGSGGYSQIGGTGHADGTFTIDNVPDGVFWLRIPGSRGGTALYRTSASAIDAGFAREGRTTQTPEASNTQLTLNLTNLQPWQDGDALELVSSEANSWHFNLEQQALSGAPALNDTALAMTIDMTDTSLSIPNHIDGTRTPADRMFITQVATHTTTENIVYQSVSRIYEPTTFAITSGQTSVLSGAFTDVSTQQTLSVQIDGAAIAASRFEETRPCDVAFSQYGLLLNASPGDARYYGSGATADFLYMSIPETLNTTLAATNMGYGIPVTGTWTPYITTTCERAG